MSTRIDRGSFQVRDLRSWVIFLRYVEENENGKTAVACTVAEWKTGRCRVHLQPWRLTGEGRSDLRAPITDERLQSRRSIAQDRCVHRGPTSFENVCTTRLWYRVSSEADRPSWTRSRASSRQRAFGLRPNVVGRRVERRYRPPPTGGFWSMHVTSATDTAARGRTKHYRYVRRRGDRFT